MTGIDYLGRVVVGDCSCCLTRHGAIIGVIMDELFISLPISAPELREVVQPGSVKWQCLVFLFSCMTLLVSCQHTDTSHQHIESKDYPP